jgi:hypothetical protein
MALITKNNLDTKMFTNAEVLALLNKVARNVDGCAFSRILDVVEDLTDSRNFEDSKIDKAEKNIDLLIAHSV